VSRVPELGGVVSEISYIEFLAKVFGDCIDHRHEQVGRCVYCSDCGRRLYHGGVMKADELAAIKEAIRAKGVE
jgi:hypothetical protein